MYVSLFGCLFVLHFASGNYLFPAWRTTAMNASFDTVTNRTSTISNVYSHLYKLNPAYWFYDNSEGEKLDKLYELVKCVIENDTGDCRNKLQTSKNIFEKKLNNEQKEGNLHNTKKNQEKTKEILSRNGDDGNVTEQKSSTQLENYTTRIYNTSSTTESNMNG